LDSFHSFTSATTSSSDHSLSFTFASIAGNTSRRLMDVHEIVVHEVNRARMDVVFQLF
jgi:hypothetical protein